MKTNHHLTLYVSIDTEGSHDISRSISKAEKKVSRTPGSIISTTNRKSSKIERRTLIICQVRRKIKRLTSARELAC